MFSHVLSLNLISNRLTSQLRHWPNQKTKKNKTGTVQEATTGQIAANEISTDAAEGVLLSQLDSVFTLKGEAALETFLNTKNAAVVFPPFHQVHFIFAFFLFTCFFFLLLPDFESRL